MTSPDTPEKREARPRHPWVTTTAVGVMLAFVLVWLLIFLRPDTWHYYTDEISVRYLDRDTDPRHVLWERAQPSEMRFPQTPDKAEYSISPDGTRLVFTRGSGEDNADLFMCRWNGKSWGDTRPLRALNSKFNETSPAFSRDGKLLYFCTDRPGGLGGFDIWVARWDGAEYAWPLPLTLLVNSKFDDLDPEPSATDDRLFFASNRPHRQFTREEDQMPVRELRKKYREKDFDVYAADRLPEGSPKEEVERALSMLYSLREGALSDTRVMTLLGGTPETEDAINRAMEWLANSQETNGSWSISRHGGAAGHDVAATSLALLTFFGRGVRHDRPGKYRETVARGLEWLTACQNRLTGDMRGPAPGPKGMYDHCIAALALGEAYGLTKDDDLFPLAQSAIDFLVDAQNDEDKSWRYFPKQAGDMSVAGWAIMALKNAQMSGLHVPERTMEGVKTWLVAVGSGKEGGLYGYQPQSGAGSPAMVATGYFCSQLMGLSPNTRRAFETVARLRGEPDIGNVYFAYYGTLSAYQNQGPFWRDWRLSMQKGFLASQARDGSWLIEGGRGDSMGRAVCTALIALSLQAHYRYTPLYGLGYEPPENPTALSTVEEADLPPAPSFRRAKLLDEFNSPADDIDVAVSPHGDFLYLASNREGGHGGFDLYRARIGRDVHRPLENVGIAVNGPADEVDPTVRDEGFNLLFSSSRGGPDGGFRLYNASSREVFLRHGYGALPDGRWFFDMFRPHILYMSIAFVILVLSLWMARSLKRRAIRSP